MSTRSGGGYTQTFLAECVGWSGSPAALFELLHAAGDGERRTSELPATAHLLRREIARVQPMLVADDGVVVIEDADGTLSIRQCLA